MTAHDVAPEVSAQVAYDWSVAIFGVNEAKTIERCILSIDSASEQRRTHISVLLNGTRDNSLDVIRQIKMLNSSVFVYTFPISDKANAINEFIYNIRPKADAYFFVDAYTRIGRNALQKIADGFLQYPNAMIVTGVPVNGRSAEATTAATLKGGVVNGQLYAVRPEFLDRLIANGLKIPLAIYRGDPLLGSMACHNLDALGTEWDNGRIVGIEGATFEISPLSIFKWNDIKRQFNREIRQARGRFENEAIKSIIYKDGYAALPESSNDMIRDFLSAHQLPPRSPKEKFFMRLALKHLKNARNASAADLTPTLAYVSETT